MKMNGNTIALEEAGSLDNELIQPGDNADYQKTVIDYLKFIEHQCFRVIRQQLKNLQDLNVRENIENEAIELSNLVIDTLQKDNYKVLRQFKGNSKLTTYITAIIARKAVDQIRKKRGRNRREEENIPRSNVMPGPDTVVKEGFLIHSEDMEENVVIPDTTNNPEKIFMDSESNEKQTAAIREVIDELDGEERLILRMRFPDNEEEKTGRIDRIAHAVGVSEKAVYKRISKIMEKCRNLLKEKGVTANDFM